MNSLKQQINIIKSFNNVFDLKENIYKLDLINTKTIIHMSKKLCNFEYLDYKRLSNNSVHTNIITMLRRNSNTDNLLESVIKSYQKTDDIKNLYVYKIETTNNFDKWDGGSYEDFIDYLYEYLNKSKSIKDYQEYLIDLSKLRL